MSSTTSPFNWFERTLQLDLTQLDRNHKRSRIAASVVDKDRASGKNRLRIQALDKTRAPEVKKGRVAP